MLLAQLHQICQKTTKAVSPDSANNTVPKSSRHSPADQNLHKQPVQTSEVNTSKHASSDAVSDFVHLEFYFLEQFVTEPTRKQNSLCLISKHLLIVFLLQKYIYLTIVYYVAHE